MCLQWTEDGTSGASGRSAAPSVRGRDGGSVPLRLLATAEKHARAKVMTWITAPVTCAVKVNYYLELIIIIIIINALFHHHHHHHSMA